MIEEQSCDFINPLRPGPLRIWEVDKIHGEMCFRHLLRDLCDDLCFFFRFLGSYTIKMDLGPHYEIGNVPPQL